MKISPLLFLKSNPPAFSAYKDDMEELSGRKISAKYRNNFIQKKELDKKQQRQIAYDILPAVKEFSDKGLYDSSILLFNEAKSVLNENDLDTTAYIAAAESYKNLGNFKQANVLYEIARNNLPYLDGMNSANVYKNYLISNIMLDKSINNEKDLSKENIFSDIANLQVEAASSLLNDKPDVNKAAEKVLKAYSAAQKLGIVDNDLYYNAATVYYAGKNFDKSAQLCKINLDILEKENKVYTKEFFDNLSLLGEVYLSNAKSTQDVNSAADVLQNAREISTKGGLNQDLRYIDYLLLKTKLETADTEEYLNSLDKFRKNLDDTAENNTLVKNILMLTAENQRLDINTNQRVKYLQEAEKIAAQEPQLNEAELFNIYFRIKELNPDMSAEYLSKINRLNSPDIKDIKTLTALLEINYENNNTEKIKSYAKLQTGNSITSDFAKAYNYMINIDEGKNFEDNLYGLENALYRISNASKTSEFKDTINKSLYKIYTKTAAMLYSAQKYQKAAHYSDKIVEISPNMKLNNSDIANNYIQNVLMNYKAKNYYTAENSCLKYLGFLLKMSNNYAGNTDNIKIYDLRNTSADSLAQGNTESQNKNIASAIETLGLINLKRKDFNDAEMLYRLGIKLRERIKDKDLNLVNDYAAISRILIANGIGGGISHSKEWHEKSLETLKNMSKNSVTNQILQEEEEFHKKYYGNSLTSFSKYIPGRNKSHIIENFKCYNKELNICE